MTRVMPPLTERQGARIRPLGLLADEPAGLGEVWLTSEQMWATTVDRAWRLAPPKLDERVNGQWSFLETLRHLVFVTDTWIGRAVLGLASPHHPMGLAPDFVTNTVTLGLDLDAQPSRDDVREARGARMAQVRDVVAQLTPGELDRVCSSLGGSFTVLGALQNVIFEEWAHHEYATRDLVVLEA